MSILASASSNLSIPGLPKTVPGRVTPVAGAVVGVVSNSPTPVSISAKGLTPVASSTVGLNPLPLPLSTSPTPLSPFSSKYLFLSSSSCLKRFVFFK